MPKSESEFYESVVRALDEIANNLIKIEGHLRSLDTTLNSILSELPTK